MLAPGDLEDEWDYIQGDVLSHVSTNITANRTKVSKAAASYSRQGTASRMGSATQSGPNISATQTSLLYMPPQLLELVLSHAKDPGQAQGQGQEQGGNQEEERQGDNPSEYGQGIKLGQDQGHMQGHMQGYEQGQPVMVDPQLPNTTDGVVVTATDMCLDVMTDDEDVGCIVQGDELNQMHAEVSPGEIAPVTSHSIRSHHPPIHTGVHADAGICRGCV